MIDNPEEQLQRVVNRLRKVVEDYTAQVIETTLKLLWESLFVIPYLFQYEHATKMKSSSSFLKLLDYA